MVRGCVAGLSLFASLAVACGSSPPRLDDGVFRSDDVAFRLGEPPPEWRPIHVEKATLAWRDEAHRASVLLDARCWKKDDDVPLQALTQHLLIGTTAREIASQETIPFDGREAMHTVVRAKLDGVPMDYDVFVFKKDGCVYDFVYVAEPGSKEGVAAFERFVGTFHTLPGAGPT